MASNYWIWDTNEITPIQGQIIQVPPRIQMSTLAPRYSISYLDGTPITQGDD